MPADFNLTITFGKSSSKYYKKALAWAQRFPCFMPMSASQSANVVSIGGKDIIDCRGMVHGIWLLIRNWKSARLTVNDKIISECELDKQLPGLHCYHRYELTAAQDLHCRLSHTLEGWGCRLMNVINRHVSHMPYGVGLCWFHCGHFITDNVWQIDKPVIIKILERDAELKRLAFCPQFSLKKALAHVKNLPDQIDLSESSEWIVKHPDDLTPGYHGGVCVEPKSWQEHRENPRQLFGNLFGNGSE